MKIFQKTRKVAKKKTAQPKKPQQEVYARAAAPTVGKKKKRKRPDDEGLALGPLTARQRRCVAAAAAGAGLAVARRPDVRGVQAAQGKRRPRAERWRGGGEAPDAWVQARVAAVVPGAAAALERALAAAPATAPPFLPLGDAATARWATATPKALVAWDGDQLRLDAVEATLEAAEALAEGQAVAHVVCLNPRGPRRRAWAAQLAALERGPWAARAVLIRVAESRCDGVKSGLAALVAEFCRAARAPTGAAVDVVVAATRNKKLVAEIEGVTVAKRVVVFEPPRNKGFYPPA